MKLSLKAIVSGTSSPSDGSARARRVTRVRERPVLEHLEERTLLSLSAPALDAVTTTALDLTPGQMYVSQLYLDLFGRPVDPVGLDVFSTALDTGQTDLQDVVAFLLTSDEYRETVTRSEFLNLLRRDPGEAGIEFGRDFLARTGNSEHLRAVILGSAEYYERAGATPEGFVRQLYLDVLGREPDPFAQGWIDALAAGTSRQEVAVGVLNSRESNEREVFTLFHRFIGEDPDPALSRVYVGALDRGVPNEQVILDIVTSRLYAARAGLDPALRFGEPDDPNAAYIEQLYGLLLGRVPRPGGLEFHLRPLVEGQITRQGLARQFLGSEESQRLSVNNLFISLLDRPATPSEMDDALAALARRARPEDLSAAVIGSEEYYQNAGGTDEQFLAAVYRDVLNRDPDPFAGVFLEALQTGVARSDVAHVILTSRESHEGFVRGMYLTLLDREPDPGAVIWVNQLVQGTPREQIIAAILGSDEFFGRLS